MENQMKPNFERTFAAISGHFLTQQLPNNWQDFDNEYLEEWFIECAVDTYEYWDWEKNDNYHPERIGGGSHTRLFWKCQSGHEWSNRVVDIVKRHKNNPQLETCLECRKMKSS